MHVKEIAFVPADPSRNQEERVREDRFARLSHNPSFLGPAGFGVESLGMSAQKATSGSSRVPNCPGHDVWEWPAAFEAPLLHLELGFLVFLKQSERRSGDDMRANFLDMLCPACMFYLNSDSVTN